MKLRLVHYLLFLHTDELSFPQTAAATEVLFLLALIEPIGAECGGWFWYFLPTTG